MGQERIFTPEELEAVGARTLDLLQSSIEKGDKETARNLSQRMYNEFLGMHDFYRDWVTALLTFIGKRYGDEVLYAALRETVGDYTTRLNKRYANKSIRRKMEILVAGLRGHLHPLKVEEDDEKFIITSHPCGSGGRLVQEGAYGPPGNFLKVKKPQPMTFQRSDFPVYCAHCYLQNISPTEPGGPPLFVTEPAQDLGKASCRMYFYKR
jgi:hypothetical protein